MRRRRSGKPAKVSYELLTRDSVIGRPLYVLLDKLVATYHKELSEARIALAWCTSWTPDPDGRVKLGMCRKASALDRELSQWDFVILLRKTFWQDLRVSELQRTALLAHELKHAAPKFDAKGEPAIDERGRRLWRIRKHDIEEFAEIVERYGMWTGDIERFASALRRGSADAFQPCDDCRDMNGWITIDDEQGVRRAKRCPCWIAWDHARRDLAAEGALVAHG